MQEDLCLVWKNLKGSLSARSSSKWTLTWNIQTFRMQILSEHINWIPLCSKTISIFPPILYFVGKLSRRQHCQKIKPYHSYFLFCANKMLHIVAFRSKILEQITVSTPLKAERKASNFSLLIQSGAVLYLQEIIKYTPAKVLFVTLCGRQLGRSHH